VRGPNRFDDKAGQKLDLISRVNTDKPLFAYPERFIASARLAAGTTYRRSGWRASGINVPGSMWSV
jgi:hypothetical protein